MKRPEKSTKKVQNLEIVKKKYSTFKKVRCGNTDNLKSGSVLSLTFHENYDVYYK